MIGGIALGRQAMEPTFPLATAAGAGVAVHMVLSMLFGVLFGIIGMIFPVLGRSAAGLLSAATAFGLALWIVNFYVIAPIAGWTWFPREANPVQQFFAHTFFYGSVLGIYFDRAAVAVRGTSQVSSELGDNLRRAA
jgi:uncharacterized membrane protein YagU involved in acid resistance